MEGSGARSHPSLVNCQARFIGSFFCTASVQFLGLVFLSLFHGRVPSYVMTAMGWASEFHPPSTLDAY